MTTFRVQSVKRSASDIKKYDVFINFVKLSAMSKNLELKVFDRSILFQPFLAFNRYSFPGGTKYTDLKVGRVYKVEYIFSSNFYVHRKTFTGICLKKDKGSHSFLLRNFFKGNSYEFRFFYTAPALISVVCLLFYKRKVRLLKVYYLRNLRQSIYQSK